MKRLECTIHVRQMQEGEEVNVSGLFDSKLFDIVDREIILRDPVEIKGHATLVGEWLVLQFNIRTVVQLKCAICTEDMHFPLVVQKLIHEEAVEGIEEIFDYTHIVREALLLEVPFFPQCAGTTCVNRAQYEKYFAKEKKDDQEQQGYTPFRDLL